MYLIPQSWPHVHILVGVFPSFGLVFILGFYIAGFLTDNNGVKRTCLVLFAISALLSIPTYLSGNGSIAALSGIPKLFKDIMNTHVSLGMVALIALVITGAVALIELWRST